MGSLRRAARSIWVRGLVSLGLLVLVLSQLDLAQLRETLDDGRWELFAAAVLVLGLAFAIGAVRWRAFLLASGIPVSVAEAERAYFAGVFATSFLPGSVGGDVARVLLVGGPGTRSRSAATVYFDRLTLLAAAAVLGWIAVYPAHPPPSLVAALGVATAAIAAVIGLTALAGAGAARIARHVPSSLRAIGRDAIAALRWSSAPRLLLGPTLGLGLVYEVLTVLSAWLVARSIDVDVSFWLLAVVAPPVLILSAVPISIGGLGVREAAYVALLGRVGVDVTDATLLSLLTGAALLLASLPGAIGLVLRGSRTPASTPADGPSRARGYHVDRRRRRT